MSHIIRIFHFSKKFFFSNFLKRYPSTFSLLLWGHIHINRILSSYSSEFRSQKFKKFSKKKKLIFESEHSSYGVLIWQDCRKTYCGSTLTIWQVSFENIFCSLTILFGVVTFLTGRSIFRIYRASEASYGFTRPFVLLEECDARWHDWTIWGWGVWIGSIWTIFWWTKIWGF